MKAEIHPQYVDCDDYVCLRRGGPDPFDASHRFAWRFAPSAIPSTLASRNSSIPPGGWRSSRRNMAWSEPPRTNVGGNTEGDHVGQIRRPGTTLYRAQ